MPLTLGRFGARPHFGGLFTRKRIPHSCVISQMVPRFISILCACEKYRVRLYLIEGNWRPRRDLNPRYRRERATRVGNLQKNKARMACVNTFLHVWESLSNPYRTLAAIL